VASYFFDSSALVKRYAIERVYDAVQLAAVLAANDENLAAGAPNLTLIPADNALNSAAIAEGLAVDNPNHHP